VPDLTAHAITVTASATQSTVVAEGHPVCPFPSREVLLEAVLDRAIAQAGTAIERSTPDEVPADDALRRLVRSSWQVLDRHLRLFEVAQR
jgi:hypothetical protein